MTRDRLARSLLLHPVIAAAAVLLWSVPVEARIVVARPNSNQAVTFQVQRADPETQDLLADFSDLLDRGEWTQAFRMMDELRTRAGGQLIERQRKGAEPDRKEEKSTQDDAGSGVLAPVDDVLRDAVLELPPAGREAFVLFYDGQAVELERTMREAAPGSDEQAGLAQRLVDAYLVTRSGAAAADLLGDVMYERGRFAEAERYWSLIARAHPGGAGIDPARLATKRALAAARSGDGDAARVLEHRLAGEVVTLAGRPVAAGEVVAMVRDGADAAGDVGSPGGVASVSGAVYRPTPILPAADAQPLWQVELMARGVAGDDSTTRTVQNRVNQPTFVMLDVPPTLVVEGDRVLGNWMGVCFAVDAESGRMLWRTQPLSDAISTSRLQQMVQMGMFHPQRFTLTPLQDRVLAVGATMGQQGDAPSLTMLDAQNGRTLWTSTKIGELRNTAFLGPVMVVGNEVLAVTTQRESAALDLRGLDLATGNTTWSLRLGEVMMPVQYGYGSTVSPLPALVRRGTTLYVITGNGATLAVDLPTRRLAWVHSYEAPPMMMTRMALHRGSTRAATLDWHTQALLHDDTLYIKEAGGRRLYALDPAQRDVQWEREADNAASLVAAAGERLFLLENRLQALDRESRSMTWALPLRGTSPVNGPIITPDHVLVCSGSGVVRVGIESGREEASFDFKEKLDRFASRGTPEGCGVLPLGDDALLTITSETITAWPLPKAE